MIGRTIWSQSQAVSLHQDIVSLENQRNRMFTSERMFRKRMFFLNILSQVNILLVFKCSEDWEFDYVWFILSSAENASSSLSSHTFQWQCWSPARLCLWPWRLLFSFICFPSKVQCRFLTEPFIIMEDSKSERFVKQFQLFKKCPNMIFYTPILTLNVIVFLVRETKQIFWLLIWWHDLDRFKKFYQ